MTIAKEKKSSATLTPLLPFSYVRSNSDLSNSNASSSGLSSSFTKLNCWDILKSSWLRRSLCLVLLVLVLVDILFIGILERAFVKDRSDRDVIMSAETKEGHVHHAIIHGVGGTDRKGSEPSHKPYSKPNEFQPEIKKKTVNKVVAAQNDSPLDLAQSLSQEPSPVENVAQTVVPPSMPLVNPDKKGLVTDNPPLTTGNPSDVSKSGNVDPSRVAIVTFFTRDEHGQELKRLTFPNWKQYAKRYGYAVIDALDDDPAMLSMFESHMRKRSVTHYFKFIVLSHYLSTGQYDWIMWADGDSIFLNQSVPLTSLLDPRFDVVFTINPKEERNWSLIVNAGHYLLKRSEWTLKFLQEAMYMSERPCTEFLNTVPGRKRPVLNGWIELCGDDGGYWLSDQGILQWLILYKPSTYRCHMQFRGFRDMNSEFPWYEDGDFIVHLPGKSNAERKVILNAFLKWTNFDNGVVDRRGTSLLDTVPNEFNARNMYEKYYKPMNLDCESVEAALKQQKELMDVSLKEHGMKIQSDRAAISAALSAIKGNETVNADPHVAAAGNVNTDSAVSGESTGTKEEFASHGSDLSAALNDLAILKDTAGEEAAAPK